MVMTTFFCIYAVGEVYHTKSFIETKPSSRYVRVSLTVVPKRASDVTDVAAQVNVLHVMMEGNVVQLKVGLQQSR
eukprot:m.67208 g.67208  ORF g.67208 m.67208 type:complete len:75 (+) comp12159_c1_seq4:938-1162(+)